MIGYTCVGTNHLDQAVHFYSELLALLGAKPFFKTDRGIGWGVSPDKPMFSVLKPYDGKPATVGNGSMVALAASNPEQVQALHAKALALGGRDEGAPGLRPQYHETYYAAFLWDPDGFKVEAVIHTPE